MNDKPPATRVLLVDDNQSIHNDIRVILDVIPSQNAAEFRRLEEALFGTESETQDYTIDLEIDSAYQGSEALDMVRKSMQEGRPYALAFVDVRMPPGWDGIETVTRIWKEHPELQVVFCTAYTDHSWKDMVDRLGLTDRFLVLKKPFDSLELRQMALALTQKWHLAQELKKRIGVLEETLSDLVDEYEKDD